MKEVLLTFIYFKIAQENLKSWPHVNRLDSSIFTNPSKIIIIVIVRIRGGRRRRRKRKKGEEEGEEGITGGGKEGEEGRGRIPGTAKIGGEK